MTWMSRRFTPALALLCLTVYGSGCVVGKSTYQACLADLAKARHSLDQRQDELAEAMAVNHALTKKMASVGQNADKLLGDKNKLAHDSEALRAQVAELTRMRAQAEARNAEYRKLLAKLHALIDAGTLQVKIRNGRMLVQMSSDLLFPPGGVRLRPAAKASIVSLAETLSTFPDRLFQVIGHSDSTPIRSPRFPSNWELSAERAIEVAKVMIAAGLAPQMLSAAGYAEFDPLLPNDTAEHKAINRRVELVFLPRLDELPGFSDAVDAAAAPAGDGAAPDAEGSEPADAAPASDG